MLRDKDIGKVRYEEILVGDRYAHYIDCSNGFTGIYICQNSWIVHLKMQFTVCQLYVDKVVI